MTQKKPKANAYYLFMQEMSQTKPGWINKKNHELQVLCDSLWKALSKEEKARYKQMSKDKKREELGIAAEAAQDAVRAEFLMKFQNLSLDPYINGLTRIYLLDVISVTHVSIAPEAEIKKIQRFLHRNDFDLVKINPDFVEIDLQGLARFSEDSKLYRCKVTEKNGSYIKVYYLDFGNVEELRSDELFRMPSELIGLNPLCVKIKIAGINGSVRNTKKNKEKIESALSVNKLFISLNKKKEATFFDGEDTDKQIYFNLCRKKNRAMVNTGNLDTIEEGEEEEEEYSSEEKEITSFRKGGDARGTYRKCDEIMGNLNRLRAVNVDAVNNNEYVIS